jgi:hypothetical protein
MTDCERTTTQCQGYTQENTKIDMQHASKQQLSSMRATKQQHQVEPAKNTHRHPKRNLSKLTVVILVLIMELFTFVVWMMIDHRCCFLSVRSTGMIDEKEKWSLLCFLSSWSKK